MYLCATWTEKKTQQIQEETRSRRRREGEMIWKIKNDNCFFKPSDCYQFNSIRICSALSVYLVREIYLATWIAFVCFWFCLVVLFVVVVSFRWYVIFAVIRIWSEIMNKHVAEALIATWSKPSDMIKQQFLLFADTIQAMQVSSEALTKCIMKSSSDGSEPSCHLRSREMAILWLTFTDKLNDVESILYR